MCTRSTTLSPHRASSHGRSSLTRPGWAQRMEAQKQMKLTLEAEWKVRLSLRADGSKLSAEGDKLRAEGSKLCAEGDKLSAEGDKLSAEGSKLWSEGDKLWAEGTKLRAEGSKLSAEGDIGWFTAIISAFGNVTVSWKGDSCILPNGELYNP